MLLRKWDICHSEVYDLSLGCVTWARCFTKQTTQQVGATEAGSWWIHTHTISRVDCCQECLDQFLCFLLPPKHHLKVLSKMQISSHHSPPLADNPWMLQKEVPNWSAWWNLAPTYQLEVLHLIPHHLSFQIPTHFSRRQTFASQGLLLCLFSRSLRLQDAVQKFYPLGSIKTFPRRASHVFLSLECWSHWNLVIWFLIPLPQWTVSSSKQETMSSIYVSCQ